MKPIEISINSKSGTLNLYILAVILFFLLSLPILVLACHDISVSALFEESLGYRYFYSLRILYSDERPWLPQGQLPGITHIITQAILSALHYSKTDLLPRMDIFSYISAIFPLILGVVTYVWAAGPICKKGGRVLLASGVIASTYAYSPRMFFPFWHTIPDYMSWEIPICLIAIGAAFRQFTVIPDLPVWNFKSALWLGVFIGTAIAIKLTLIVFPFAIFCIMFFRDRQVYAIMFGLYSFIIGFLIFIIINWIYYLGDIHAVLNFFSNEHQFLQQSAIMNISFHELLSKLKPTILFDHVIFIIMMPVFLLTFGLLKPKDRMLLALIPATLFSLFICFKRFYWPTLVETLFFSFFLSSVIIFRLEKIPVQRCFSKYDRQLTVVLSLMLLAITWYLVPLKTISDILVYYQQYNVAGSQLRKLMNYQMGRTALLGIDNHYRIPTFHTSICKGGINVNSYKWGDSPFIKSMFNEMVCYMVPQGIAEFNFKNVAFLKLPNERSSEAIQKIQKAFSISLKNYDCSLEFSAPLPEALDATIIFCTMHSEQ